MSADRCKFSTYGYPCGKHVDHGRYLCDEHAAAKCASCGQPATHGCDFCGQFVCGMPLCDECTFGTDETKSSGSWGFLNHIHISKPEFAIKHENARLKAEVAKLTAELDAARRSPEAREVLEVLGECIDTLALVEHPAFVDPVHGNAVKALGDRIGYGALMSSASASWRAVLEASGTPGGEFVSGPCHSTVVRTLRLARALAQKLGGVDG